MQFQSIVTIYTISVVGIPGRAASEREESAHVTVGVQGFMAAVLASAIMDDGAVGEFELECES